MPTNSERDVRVICGMSPWYGLSSRIRVWSDVWPCSAGSQVSMHSPSLHEAACQHLYKLLHSA